MKNIRPRFLEIPFFLLMLIFGTQMISGQEARCLTEAEAEKTINLINNTSPPASAAENKSLRREILNMQEDRQKFDRKILENLANSQNLIVAANQMGEKHLLRVCEIIKQNGWVGKEALGEDGLAAMTFLIKNNKAIALQKEIFPVVAAAAKKGIVHNGEIATLIDTIRVNQGGTQIFGTQARVRDEMLYLHPLQNEAKVDEWRKLYDLAPLSVFIKVLQSEYNMPVLKSPAVSIPPELKEKKQTNVPTASANAETPDPLSDFENEEVVKVESNLVNLNVRVYNNDLSPANFNLQKEDFAVYENGKQQMVEFFSATDAPFDLILLLDLSGSTSGKQNLIRKSTQRFIEAARPNDRIAIVTFTSQTRIVSPLTANRQELLKSLKNIDDYGGSGVWGGLQFVYDQIIKLQSKGRRSAVVMMTDGVDSSLLSGALMTLPPNYPTFIDVLETVRNGETAVIPIYLDTESDATSREKIAYRSGRRTLNMLAEESGNQTYYAKRLEDLNGIYERIINDLGRVYSLGYQPADENQDASKWRLLTIKTPNHPNLIVRTKAGYYAK